MKPVSQRAALCAKCGAGILWVTTESGSRIPLDAPRFLLPAPDRRLVVLLDGRPPSGLERAQLWWRPGSGFLEVREPPAGAPPRTIARVLRESLFSVELEWDEVANGFDAYGTYWRGVEVPCEMPDAVRVSDSHHVTCPKRRGPRPLNARAAAPAGSTR